MLNFASIVSEYSTKFWGLVSNRHCSSKSIPVWTQHSLALFSAGLLSLLLYGFLSPNSWRPYYPDGDLAITLTIIKQLIAGGELTAIQDLGFPGGLDFSTFPLFDFFQFFLIKIANIFAKDNVFGVLHLYQVLATITNISAAYLICIYINPNRIVHAILFSLLIGVVSQSQRISGHNFLYSFHASFLGVYLLLRMFFPAKGGKLIWLVFDSLAVILIATSGIYYCGFVLISLTAWSAIAMIAREWRTSFYGTMLIALIGATLLCAILAVYPRIIFDPQLLLPNRTVYDQPFSALRISDAALQFGNSQFGWHGYSNKITSQVAKYRTTNEGYDAWGGMILATIILTLPFWLIIKALLGRIRVGIFDQIGERNEKLKIFAAGNVLMMLLFAVPYGYGYLFNVIVSPVLRAQNRISLMLIAMAAIFLIVKIKEFEARLRWKATLILAVLTALNFYPVINAWPRWLESITQDTWAVEFTKARAANAAIAKFHPTVVLQLPIADFPEVPPIRNFEPYQHLVLPLLSSGTDPKPKWTYGVLPNTYGHAYQQYFFKNASLRDSLGIGACLGFPLAVIEKRAYALDEVQNSFGDWDLVFHDDRRAILRRRAGSEVDCKQLLAATHDKIRSKYLFQSGWNDIEPWGIWAKTQKPTLLIPPQGTGECTRVSFTLRGLLPEAIVKIEDGSLNLIVLLKSGVDEKVSFDVKTPTSNVSILHELRFNSNENPKSPRDLGVNKGDRRRISFGLLDLDFDRCAG